MIRMIASATALVFAVSAALPVEPAAAQNNTVGGALLGGAAGAIIGGAATGRAGGAIAGGIIGAAAGAALGSQLEPRSGGYYWYNGHCYFQRGDGNYYLVNRRNCY